MLKSGYEDLQRATTILGPERGSAHPLTGMADDASPDRPRGSAIKTRVRDKRPEPPPDRRGGAKRAPSRPDGGCPSQNAG